jgi:hypothetical protein
VTSGKRGVVRVTVRRNGMGGKGICAKLLLLLACGVAIATLASCDLDYREAGRQSGELAREAGGTVAAEVEERAPTVIAEVEERAPTVIAEVEERAPTVAAEVEERAPTVAAEVEERAPTVVAEVEERAPTVAAEAAEAARDFSEGVRESGVCSGAAMVVLGAGLMAAVVQRRR